MNRFHYQTTLDFFSTDDCWRGSHRCDLVEVYRLPRPGSTTVLYTTASSTISAHARFVLSGIDHVFHLVLRPDVDFVPPRLVEVSSSNPMGNVTEELGSIFLCCFALHEIFPPYIFVIDDSKTRYFQPLYVKLHLELFLRVSQFGAG